jgi:release factor glutamine methyltransferase
VADVGTGSGAIALALATEGNFQRVIATDVSVAALDVAKKNAATYSSRIRGALEFRPGSLLEPLAGESLDALVSNPPYIAESEMESLPAEVRDWEPERALSSGPEGLDATIAIIAGAPDILVPGGLLALEVDTRRAGRTADILNADGRYEKIEIIADLTGRQRFVAARRR